MKPIVIIGGGLAGLSLGAALQESGIETTILEAGAYPRHRVCGEFISGLAPEDSNRLGLGPSLADARRLSTVSWHRNGREVCRYRLPQPALGLSRFTLDARLAARFQAAGGTLASRTRVRENKPEPGTIRTTGHRVSPSPFIGLKAHFHGISLATDLEMHLGEQAYVGLSPVEGGAVNLCGLFRRRPIRGSIPEMLDRYLGACGLKSLQFSLQSGKVVADSPCAVAGLDYGRPSSARSHVSLGDARQLIPPFTGAGMATAFAAAAESLEPLGDYTHDAIDWNEATSQIQTRLNRRLTRRLRTARLLHPFLLHPRRQAIVAGLARCNLLPFGLLFRLLH